MLLRKFISHFLGFAFDNGLSGSKATAFVSFFVTFHYVVGLFSFNTGIYGHSAVYQKQYKSIYIFGGHVFKDERLQLSEYLFTYDVTDATWNVLQPEPSVEMLNNRWSLVCVTV